MLTKEILNELLYYDHLKGRLFFKPRGRHWFNSDKSFDWWNKRFENTECFKTKNVSGHLSGRLLGNTYSAHRIIWLMHSGYWPENIDHIDGNPQNNLLNNLREVNHQENCKNQKRPKNNTSGVQGVSWFAPTNKWKAYIRVGGKLKHLGYFSSLEEAAKVRKQAEKDESFHENHGR